MCFICTNNHFNEWNLAGPGNLCRLRCGRANLGAVSQTSCLISMLKSLYAKWFWQVWTNSPLSNQFVTGQAIAHRNYFSVLPTRNYHLVHNFARARPHQLVPDIVGRFPSLLRMRNLSRSLRTSNRLMFFEGRGSKRSETTQSGIKILDKFIFQGAHRFQAGEAIFHFFWPEPPEKRDPSSFVRAAVQFSSPEDVILPPPGGRCIHQEGFRARWKTI